MTDDPQGHGSQPITYDWDEAKNERNLAERELSFDLAILMFELPVMQFLDDRRDYGELRMRAIGLVGNLVPALRLHGSWRCAADHQLASCQPKGT